METKTQEQVLGPGVEDKEKEEEIEVKPVEDPDKTEELKGDDIKIDDKEKDKNMSAGCENNIDDGIMNCENDKN